jgi:hypothetical protein
LKSGLKALKHTPRAAIPMFWTATCARKECLCLPWLSVAVNEHEAKRPKAGLDTTQEPTRRTFLGALAATSCLWNRAEDSKKDTKRGSKGRVELGEWALTGTPRLDVCFVPAATTPDGSSIATFGTWLSLISYLRTPSGSQLKGKLHDGSGEPLRSYHPHQESVPSILRNQSALALKRSVEAFVFYPEASAQDPGQVPTHHRGTMHHSKSLLGVDSRPTKRHEVINYVFILAGCDTC